MSQVRKRSSSSGRAARAPRGGEPGPDAVVGPPGARERILVAAQDLFYANGYAATSVASIAEAAQMTTPNLYWHFPSKQRLLGEVINRAHRSFLEDLRTAIPESGSAADLLDAYVRNYVRIQLGVAEDGVVYGYWVLAADLAPEDAARLVETRREIHGILRDIVQQGVSDGSFSLADPSLAISAIETSCEYVFTWFKPSGRLSADEVVEGYVEIALRIVGCPSAG